MIYEYRRYEVMPGRLRELHERFADRALRYWEKHGIRAVGFWEPMVGPSGELHYILAWDSLQERAQKWPAFTTDPEWRAEFEETERLGPLVARYTNALWAPTPYSAMK